eukprot:12423604-Karenia_brevis.AAC.1
MSLDQVVEWSRAWQDAVKKDKSLETLNSAVGRVADLKSAYKQLPLHPGHLCFCVIAVLDPNTGVPKLFISRSLMFGQTAAVYAFLRFSRAFSFIATDVFWIFNVPFFDDFTQVEPKATAHSAMVTMEAMFDILGWQVSMSETKRLEFSKIFISLGAQLDFTDVHSGSIIIRNKPGRAQAIIEQINQALRAGLTTPALLSIRGRIIYAE